MPVNIDLYLRPRRRVTGCDQAGLAAIKRDPSVVCAYPWNSFQKRFVIVRARCFDVFAREEHAATTCCPLVGLLKESRKRNRPSGYNDLSKLYWDVAKSNHVFGAVVLEYRQRLTLCEVPRRGALEEYAVPAITRRRGARLLAPCVRRESAGSAVGPWAVVRRQSRTWLRAELITCRSNTQRPGDELGRCHLVARQSFRSEDGLAP